ncbi:hypothetical protein GCM10007158_18570 [Vreelandella hamiltonii]|uniref:Uncharacterized protein n=2 Tax=Halomonadaceae TaxID=28256 RepID=A0A8H9LXH4_9GAMM|nr:hypothetical protein GCM10007157_29860 [Halomonas hamiltonii]GGW57881.1 hypothetical protein GCM10007158_18570 [Halomonas johnsoniae]
MYSIGSGPIGADTPISLIMGAVEVSTRREGNIATESGPTWVEQRKRTGLPRHSVECLHGKMFMLVLKPTQFFF